MVIANYKMLPQRSEIAEIEAAVPEMNFLQPRGVYRMVVRDGLMRGAEGFAKALAVNVGTLMHTLAEVKSNNLAERVRENLAIRRPVYVEDDPTGVGACAVCGKRGALGRCEKCGLLMHYGCIADVELQTKACRKSPGKWGSELPSSMREPCYHWKSQKGRRMHACLVRCM